MEIHLKVTGILLIILAFIHIVFPRYFNWDEELKSLSIMNRQMMYVHSFFIAFVVLLMGILCITSYSDLINTPFGKKISLAIGVFWILRLLIQFFGYSAKIWKGKRFETSMHVLFTLLWSYLSVVFVTNYLE